MQSLGESREDGTGDALAALPRLLRAEGLSFAWRGRPVLQDVNLTLEAGSVVALRGPNGTGKTTLLRLLAGALEPYAGAVHLDEPTGAGDRRVSRRALGLVSAGDRGLYARLDVRANVELAVALALVPRNRQRGLVAAAIKRFDLVPLRRRRVDRLSTGQRQRVRLAIGFAHDPRVVLLDEPTASLDAEGTGLLAEALTELAARGGASLWTAPDGPDAPAALPATRAYALLGARLRAC